MNQQQLDQLARMAAQPPQQQPMQLAQPLNADAILALIASGLDGDAEERVNEAVDLLARCSLAVTQGALKQRYEELATAPRLFEAD